MWYQGRLYKVKSTSDVIPRKTLQGQVYKVSDKRHVQTTTDLARLLPCFNPIGAILAVRSGAFLREQKYYLITNSNFWENTDKQKHASYSLQPTIARTEWIFDNSGDI